MAYNIKFYEYKNPQVDTIIQHDLGKPFTISQGGLGEPIRNDDAQDHPIHNESQFPQIQPWKFFDYISQIDARQLNLKIKYFKDLTSFQN